MRDSLRELQLSTERERLTALRMTRLQEATARLAAPLLISDVCETFLSVSEELLGAAAGVVYLADESGALRLQGSRNVPNVAERMSVLPLDAPLPLAAAIARREPIWLASYAAVSAAYPDVASSETPSTRLQAVAALPLVHGDRVIGGIALSFGETRTFDQDDRDWLASFVSHCALALDRARLYEAGQRARAEAETMLGIAESLNAAGFDLETLVQRVTDEGTALVGARFGAFFYNVTNEQGERYRLYTLSGAPKEAFEKFGLPRNTAVFGPTFAGERVVRLDDVTKDPRYGRLAPHHGMPKGHLPVTSYLAVPVVARSGTVIGGLFFGHPEPGQFTEQHERMVRALAASAAVAFDNARTFREARDAEESQRRLVAELTETLRMNELFAGVLAHDLRNPLGAIMTAAQVVSLRTDDEKISAPMSRILRSGGRMARMVDQLLDITRIRAGAGMSLEPRRCDLLSLLRQVIDEFDGSHPEWSLVLEHDGDTHGDWDEDRLCQAFSNLVGNALQHGLPEGGVRVRLDGADPSIVRVRVQNMGAVPAELIPKLFDPLTAGDRPRDRSRGLGLGLFITHEIARAHGGSIEVESTTEKGTTFLVTLPRFNEAAHR